MITPLFTDPSPLGGGSGAWGWTILALLGAWHGLNPGMGWLFAAALGLQEGRGGAAWRALPPLALGHALAVGAALAALLLLGFAVPPEAVRWTVAVALMAYGTFRLLRRGHPRFGGMRVGARDLTIWSFLMASVHGAGLMVLPFVGGRSLDGGTTAATGPDHSGHLEVMGASVLPAGTGEVLAALLVHTATYLLVTGLLAVLVVHWWGLRLLRSLWIDLDRIWAGALILTGVLTLVL
jgi:hypothetical protein